MSEDCGFQSDADAVMKASGCDRRSHFQSGTVNSKPEEETEGLSGQSSVVFHYTLKQRKENRDTLFIYDSQSA